MSWEATPFANLPVTDDAWDPDGEGAPALMNAVLGEDDWARYRKAHLIHDPDNAEVKAGYKLPIARMFDGTLKAVQAQISQAIGAINGSRAPLAVPDAVRQAAYDNAIRYLKKAGIEEDQLPKYKASKAQARAARGQVVKLATEATGDERVVWVQVARAGDYLGYKGGDLPFRFTRVTFEQAIRNLHAHPSFQAGADGVGTADVIPWDFEHASAMPAGAIAADGAPAQGWTRDMEIRTGADGRDELWALTRWLEPAATYIKEGRYQGASVSMDLNAIDGESGERVGARVLSIAMTNDPFIEGMNKLVASRMHYYGEAETATEAVEAMKDLFGLPMLTDLGVVQSSLAQCAQWMDTGTTPPGIDMDAIIGALRQILKLSALISATEVLRSAASIAARVLEERAAQAGQAAPPELAKPEPAVMENGYWPFAGTSDTFGTNSATAANRKHEEEEMTILSDLAKRLRVRDAEDAVLDAVDEAIELRGGVSQALGLERDSNDEILARAKRVQEDTVHLTQVREALGTADHKATVAKVAELVTASKELADLKPKYEALAKEAEERDKAMAEADVEAVIASRGLPEDTKAALLLFRTQQPEEFAKQYPPLDPKQQRLVAPLLAKPKKKEGDGEPDGPKVIDLRAYEGRNLTHRAKQFIAATVDGADKFDEKELGRRAYELLRTNQVIE